MHLGIVQYSQLEQNSAVDHCALILFIVGVNSLFVVEDEVAFFQGSLTGLH